MNKFLCQEYQLHLMSLTVKGKRPRGWSKRTGRQKFLAEDKYSGTIWYRTPGVPKLKLEESGCLLFNRKDVNFGALYHCNTHCLSGDPGVWVYQWQ